VRPHFFVSSGVLQSRTSIASWTSLSPDRLRCSSAHDTKRQGPPWSLA
jgi:hypothetical protein